MSDFAMPPSLQKALTDPFDYELRLRTGEIIRFETAVLNGEFVTLTLLDRDYHSGCAGSHDRSTELVHSYPRGLDVRLSDIVWCADAPDGS